jgi:drug/metabolite transporter (DMT)-like permease
VAIMAHFLLQDDRLTIRKIAGIALAFVGVAILFSGGPSGGRAGLIGDLMIICSSFLWAAQTIYIKRWTDHWDSIPLVLHPMVLSMGIFGVCYFFLEAGSPQVFDAGVIGSLLYQSVIAAGFGYIGWTELLLKYKASSLSVFVFIMPVATVLLGVLLMGDVFSTRVAVSLALVAVGILVVNIAPREAFVMPE